MINLIHIYRSILKCRGTFIPKLKVEPLLEEDEMNTPVINDMSTAPTGRIIMLHLPDGVSFWAELHPFDHGGSEDVWGWICLEEGKAPKDWTDDTCWSVNEDGKTSTQPIGWSELEI